MNPNLIQPYFSILRLNSGLLVKLELIRLNSSRLGCIIQNQSIVLFNFFFIYNKTWMVNKTTVQNNKLKIKIKTN